MLPALSLPDPAREFVLGQIFVKRSARFLCLDRHIGGGDPAWATRRIMVATGRHDGGRARV